MSIKRLWDLFRTFGSWHNRAHFHDMNKELRDAVTLSLYARERVIGVPVARLGHAELLFEREDSETQKIYRTAAKSLIKEVQTILKHNGEQYGHNAD
jgi:hypothetical protein